MKAMLVMGMPNSCDDCDLCVEYGSCYSCAATGEVMARPYDIISEWCPLIPMPEQKQN